LNSEFQPSSQVLCPHCNSPNPTFTKLCLYCGRKI
jgi:DNA-directed RNA polymerase subunit RPC12/RpoP